MEEKDIAKKIFRKRKQTLVFTAGVALLAVLSLGVSTFAWFQANADVNITAEGDSAEITVSAPESVKFYYFNGNGTPGGSNYYGYSNSASTVGNTVNKIDIANNRYTTNSGTSYSYYDGTNGSSWASTWTEIPMNNAAAVNNAFNLSKMRAGCYYSFCVYCGDLSTAKLKITFSWTNSGTGAVVGSRYLGETANPLNLLMAVNGYGVSSGNTVDNSTSFLDGTVGASSGSDKIIFTPVASSNETLTESYYLLGSAGEGANVSNHYVYFTIFMGFPLKTDALTYNGYDSVNSRNKYIVDTNGGYGPLDGLVSTLTTIEVL